MGQYYRIVNLDKKEFLMPSEFGDGDKLLEFGVSACGVMSGLAILLADSNGRGGGDLYRTGPVADLGKIKSHQKVGSSWTHTDFTGEVIPWENRIPKIAGSWAGDRIVVTGDYADANRWGVESPDANLYKSIREDEQLSLKDRKFRNISADVIKAMKDDSFLKQELALRLEDQN